MTIHSSLNFIPTITEIALNHNDNNFERPIKPLRSNHQERELQHAIAAYQIQEKIIGNTGNLILYLSSFLFCNLQ